MFLDIIGSALEARDIRFVRVDGTTKIDERQATVDSFQKEGSGVDVIISSLKAGGQGLNLTAADRVVLMDLSWNPQDNRQAEDRAHRLGQTRPVTVTYMTCKGTVEEKVVKCNISKMKLDYEFGGQRSALEEAEARLDEEGQGQSGSSESEGEELEESKRKSFEDEVCNEFAQELGRAQRFLALLADVQRHLARLDAQVALRLPVILTEGFRLMLGIDLQPRMSWVRIPQLAETPSDSVDVAQLQRLQPHEEIPCVFVNADGSSCSNDAEADQDGDGLLAPRASLETPATSDLLPCYFLDGASALAAALLEPGPGASVLDLCAAPGGKSLMLASLLFAGPEASGRLICNEMSRPRLARLQKVVSSFLPPEMLATGATGRVSLGNVDAATGSIPVPLQRLAPFDRVLVDAPCTSDRHLVHQGASALAHWAAGAVKANAERQLELLRAAAALVKPGGLVLYVTCALAEAENDGVVSKFLKKFGQNFALDAFPDQASRLLQGADATQCGVLILPDRTPYGPMYISRLRRH
ncbi:NSUN3 [Symbiodinium sp. KB8]|nr:NSUN3 [Symbiodinium sp. KB8]